MSDLVWLDKRDALLIHERLLVLHGGASGVRDVGLLDAALARPQQHAAYALSDTAMLARDQDDLVFLAAMYTAGVVHNHPFVDGNKRTGFVLGVLFLELNGLSFNAAEADAAQAVIALAAGRMEIATYAEFLRCATRPTEV